MRRVRSHPVAGALFLFLGLLLVAAGALGSWSIDVPGPLPAHIVFPFIFWQLAVWSILFGIFFLRARGPVRGRAARGAVRS